MLKSTNDLELEPLSPTLAATVQAKRVYAFIDGFNLYHALDSFDRGVSDQDKGKYRVYKWLCLTSLIDQFIREDEELSRVIYFTTYPTWDRDKRLRHETYVNAQRHHGVEVILGEFKSKNVTCRASCREVFQTNEEKQTDINIATALIECADDYDVAILVTADSDQVPAVRLLRKLYPAKTIISLPPVGRSSKELKKACHLQSKMTEAHLLKSQLDNPLRLGKRNGQEMLIVKPTKWPSPSPQVEQFDLAANAETEP